MEKKIPISKPYFWKNEREYVLKALDSVWVSSKGAYVALFEDTFSSILGVKHALAVTSCTSALQLALDVIGVRAGDEVIQLYIQRPNDLVKGLKKFSRISLNPGETKKVSFMLDKSALSFYDISSGKWKVETGNYTIFVGRSSQDIRLKSVVKID